MIFSGKDQCWIQHGNGIYIFKDGTKAIAKFQNGKFDLQNYSVQVTYAGSGRQYSGRMSMFEGQPFPHGKGVLTETKQGATEKQKGEFKEGVLYNGTLTLDKEDLCISIEVIEGKLVLEKDPKDDVPEKQSWADALEEEWKRQEQTRGYSDKDVWDADQAAKELIKEEGKEIKPNPTTKPTRTTNNQSKRGRNR
jgi:hypothetical protein